MQTPAQSIILKWEPETLKYETITKLTPFSTSMLERCQEIYDVIVDLSGQWQKFAQTNPAETDNDTLHVQNPQAEVMNEAHFSNIRGKLAQLVTKYAITAS